MRLVIDYLQFPLSLPLSTGPAHTIHMPFFEGLTLQSIFFGGPFHVP